LTSSTNHQNYHTIEVTLSKRANITFKREKEDKEGGTMDPREEDIDNMEHLGEFDHGLLPHGQQTDESSSQKMKQLNKTYLDIKDAVMKVERSCATSVKNAIKSVEKNLVEAVTDDQVQEGLSSHTEEEVAGMKLCVKSVVHAESFEAPC
jgi:hypothetical protein